MPPAVRSGTRNADALPGLNHLQRREEKYQPKTQSDSRSQSRMFPEAQKSNKCADGDHQRKEQNYEHDRFIGVMFLDEQTGQRQRRRKLV